MSELPLPTLIVDSGPSGSGKTTLARDTSNEYRPPLEEIVEFVSGRRDRLPSTA